MSALFFPNFSTALSAVICFFTGILIWGCSSKSNKDETGDADTNSTSIFSSITGRSLPSGKVAVDSSFRTPVKELIKTETSENEICTVEKIKWRPGSPEGILLDPQGDVIYPGSVLDGSSIQDGKFTPLNQNRLPITISVSMPNLDTISQTVQDPQLSNIREAQKKILNSTFKGAHPAQLSIDSYEVFAKEQLSLIFKGKYSGGVNKIESGFNFDNQSIKSRYMLDITQVYYSTDINIPSSEGFFKKIPDNIGTISPVVVSSIKYGRKIIISIETKENIQGQALDLRNEFSLFAADGSLSASSKTQKLLNEGAVKILVMGGNPDIAFDIFKAISDKSELFNILKKDAVWSMNNLGVPLAYSLRYATDGSIFTVSQYGEYVSRRCIIKPENEKPFDTVILTNLCPIHTGGDREFNGHGPNTDFSVKLSLQGNNIVAKVRCVWTETRSDFTQGVFDKDIVIGTVPPNLRAIAITSPISTVWSYQDQNGHAAEGNTFNQDGSPVKLVSIMGDTGDDDDISFDCSKFMNTGILRIEFYPVIVKVREIN